MTTQALTENVEKYPRGKHPNSRRNLKPFQPGQSGNPEGKQAAGPVFTPAMRRFAAMPLPKVKELAKKPEALTMAEAIAITTLIDALTTGSFSTGAKSREQVFRKLDGDDGLTINDNRIQVLVRQYGGFDPSAID